MSEPVREKFMIGAQVWPGISKLIEECGEVVEVCGQMAMYVSEEGMDRMRARLQDELADLAAASHFVAVRNGLDVESSIEPEEYDQDCVSTLIRSCGTVVQVCGKLLGTGGRSDHWDGSNLHQRLEVQLRLLSAVTRSVILSVQLSDSEFQDRMREKIERFNKWHHDGEQLPKV